VKYIDIAVTNHPDGCDADIYHDGSGHLCQKDWDVYGCSVRVEQRMVYEGRRHMVLALLFFGAVSIKWIDLPGNKTHSFCIDDVDKLL
jgi:hypothetical protein